MLLCVGPAAASFAQPPTVPGAASQAGFDLLADALACRVGDDRIHALLPLLRQQRPDDFAQAYRQYSAPPMDLYRLRAPVAAWGQRSDSVAIASDRVMMAVEGTPEEVSAALERSLETSSESPLSGALDDAHALVIFGTDLPGLEGMVLLGCEYRIPGVSLLQDPEEAWRVRGVDAPADTADQVQPQLR